MAIINSRHHVLIIFYISTLGLAGCKGVCTDADNLFSNPRPATLLATSNFTGLAIDLHNQDYLLRFDQSLNQCLASIAPGCNADSNKSPSTICAEVESNRTLLKQKLRKELLIKLSTVRHSISIVKGCELQARGLASARAESILDSTENNSISDTAHALYAECININSRNRHAQDNN